MENILDKKRITIFLGISFGLAWIFAVVIALSGGLVNSPELVPDTGFTLALVLTVMGYMWAPAIANVLTRLLTREGWKDIGLFPRIREATLTWVIAWIGPAVLTILGAALYFVLFPGQYDSEFTQINQFLAESGNLEGVSPWGLVLTQVIASVLAAPLINSLFTFGEEFGWRGYLLGKLMPLGARKAMVTLGIIWGVWHWPMIAMGHNYGLDYVGAPWLGMLLTLWFTFTTGVFLSFVTLRGKSVWPAVVGHAAINGIANIGSLFVIGQSNPLLGPLPVGLIGSAAWGVVAIVLMLNPRWLTGEHALV